MLNQVITLKIRKCQQIPFFSFSLLFSVYHLGSFSKFLSFTLIQLYRFKSSLCSLQFCKCFSNCFLAVASELSSHSEMQSSKHDRPLTEAIIPLSLHASLSSFSGLHLSHLAHPHYSSLSHRSNASANWWDVFSTQHVSVNKGLQIHIQELSRAQK